LTLISDEKDTQKFGSCPYAIWPNSTTGVQLYHKNMSTNMSAVENMAITTMGANRDHLSAVETTMTEKDPHELEVGVVTSLGQGEEKPTMYSKVSVYLMMLFSGLALGSDG
jgi:hypothetical protein